MIDFLMKLAISIVILVFLILIFIKNRQESYQPAFPKGEVKYYHNKQNQFGIPQCTYGGYTPILTCSYDSKV